MILDGALGCRHVQLEVAAEKAFRLDMAEHHVAVGHGRPRAAAAVAGGARIGAGAVGADGDAFQLVDARDRAAAGPDLDHLDDRDAQWQAAALFEAVDARDLESAAGLRLKIVDQADLRGRAAHIVRQNGVEPALPRDLAGKDGTPGGAAFDKTHRKADCGFDRRQPAS